MKLRFFECRELDPPVDGEAGLDYKVEVCNNVTDKDNRVSFTEKSTVTPFIDKRRCRLAVYLYNLKFRRTGVYKDEIFDWRALAVMPIIKRQGPCGCCYAVAVADNISVVHYINNEEYVELSGQDIVDNCTWTNGCDGGIILMAFLYAVYRRGLPRLLDYPYAGKQNKPKSKKVLSAKGVNIDAVMRVGYYSEANIMRHVKVQPISVTIYWGPKLAKHKSTDIYEGESALTWLKHSTGWDPIYQHSLLLIGFSHNNRGDYWWLLQNSHGEDCGDRGVIKIRRGGKGKKDVLFGTMENGVLKFDGLVTKANFPVAVPA